MLALVGMQMWHKQRWPDPRERRDHGYPLRRRVVLGFFAVANPVVLPHSFVWEKWRHFVCIYLISCCWALLAWLGGTCSSLQRWAFILSRAALVTHKADIYKKERKKLIRVIFHVPYWVCILPSGGFAPFFGGSWDPSLLQAGCCFTRNTGVSYFGDFPYLEHTALSMWFFSKARGRRRETTAAFQGRGPMGSFGVLPSH